MDILPSLILRSRAWPWVVLLVSFARAGAAIPPPLNADSTGSRIAFISDTQAPIVFERLFLRSDRNTDATRALLHDILQIKPSRLFVLGDLTSAGFYDRSWEMVDSFFDSLRRQGSGVDAIRGNHELMLYPAEGEKNFHARFPEASRTGYVRTVDSVAIVLLNSNFNHLTPAEVLEQQEWYARTLDSLDAEEAIHAIVVCCHHSPYSNSTVEGSSTPVRERFVPAFIASRKSELFLSGHAHAFEHFRKSGKDFLVMGGGGGLLHPLNEGSDKIPGDLAPMPRPRFHYVVLQRSGRQLLVTIRALQPDHATVQSIACPLQAANTKLIYSSDLYSPPDDPDDYFDLATLFSLPEIDVRCVLLDQQIYDKRPASEGTGATPLRQMFSIARRTAGYSIGLRSPLKSIDDQGLDQDPLCQRGVTMLLDSLIASRDQMVILTVGTLRDVAAAYNRNPRLFREKVSKIYVNAGVYGFPTGRFDVNLEKDRNAFVAIMKSGLPVYWAPCFGEDNFETHWQVGQGTLISAAPPVLKNFFLFAFQRKGQRAEPDTGRKPDDPVSFLRQPPDTSNLKSVYAMTRNMWSTATFLDAAGLSIFADGKGGYGAFRGPTGGFVLEAHPYSFELMNLFIDTQGRVHPGMPGNTKVHVLHKDDPVLYQKALERILSGRFSEM